MKNRWQEKNAAQEHLTLPSWSEEEKPAEEKEICTEK